jgi:hypothetical protein
MGDVENHGCCAPPVVSFTANPTSFSVSKIPSPGLRIVRENGPERGMSSGPWGWGARVWGTRNRQLPSPQVVPKRSPGLDRGQFDRVVITGKADDPRPVSQES